MTAVARLVCVVFAALLGCVIAQDDFIRMMMLSQLLGGGGFGGGGGQQAAPQHTQITTGFEGDPRSIGGAGGASANPGGLFGGLMGLLSRNAGGSAPLLLDVDGDILRTHLWNRLNSPGGSGTASGAGAAPSPVSGVNHREASAVGPLNIASSGGSAGGSAGRPKSMPHTLPFDIQFTGSDANPAHLEGASPGEPHSHSAGAQPAGFNSPP